VLRREELFREIIREEPRVEVVPSIELEKHGTHADAQLESAPMTLPRLIQITHDRKSQRL
jgi:hypothetical protein